jgi:hypothetical protein
MKKKITSAIIMLSWMMVAASEPPALTNHIQLIKGVYFGLTDEWHGGDEVEWSDKELHLGNSIFWFLHNAGTNDAYPIFLGMKRTFDCRLLNKDGTEVPKTALGKRMGKGPKSPNDLDANFSILGIGHPGILIGPRQTQTMDFLKIEPMFEFPTNGEYVLEVRYWAWRKELGRFMLTHPVRMKLTKPHASSPKSAESTNIAGPTPAGQTGPEGDPGPHN